MNEYEGIPNKEEMRKKMHNNMGMNHGMPDPKKIKEILDVVSEKIPGLLKELSSLLYSPENAKNYAGAAATFSSNHCCVYHSLINRIAPDTRSICEIRKN